MWREVTNASVPMTATAPTKETILVVDDEASIRRILETRLSMIGYNVVTACDGTEALELFHDCIPDLVVLDVMRKRAEQKNVSFHFEQQLIILSLIHI